MRSLKRLSDEERDQWPQRRLFASFSATVDPPPPPSPRYGATTAGAKSRPSSPQQYQQESGNRAQGLVPSPLSFSYSSKGDKAEDIDTLIEALGSGNPSYLDIGSAKSVLEAQIIRANFDGWCHKCTSAITGWRHYICKDDRIGRWIHAVCALRGKKQRMDLQIQSPFARAALPMPQRINSPGMPAVGSGEGETDEQPVAVDEGDEESGQEEGGEEQPGMREEANKAKEQPRTGDEGEEVDNRQKVERKGEVEFGKEDRAEEAAAPHHCGWMVATRAEEDGGERMGGLRDLPAYTAEQAAAAEFEVCRGDFVVVRAFAGTGKTTTARGIIRHRLSTAPSSKILYVVFSKAAKEDLERKEAELVHAGLLSVKTCHALAKARIMRGRGGEGMEFVDADVPKVDELVQRFNLEAYANPKPGRHQERRRKAVARKLGGFIRRTLNCFLRSASRGAVAFLPTRRKLPLPLPPVPLPPPPSPSPPVFSALTLSSSSPRPPPLNPKLIIPCLCRRSRDP